LLILIARRYHRVGQADFCVCAGGFGQRRQPKIGGVHVAERKDHLQRQRKQRQPRAWSSFRSEPIHQPAASIRPTQFLDHKCGKEKGTMPARRWAEFAGAGMLKEKPQANAQKSAASDADRYF
jgi:hypothetical protein